MPACRSDSGLKWTWASESSQSAPAAAHERRPAGPAESGEILPLRWPREGPGPNPCDHVVAGGVVSASKRNLEQYLASLLEEKRREAFKPQGATSPHGRCFVVEVLAAAP